jgi:hypothetical protein
VPQGDDRFDYAVASYVVSQQYARSLQYAYTGLGWWATTGSGAIRDSASGFLGASLSIGACRSAASESLTPRLSVQ